MVIRALQQSQSSLQHQEDARGQSLSEECGVVCIGVEGAWLLMSGVVLDEAGDADEGCMGQVLLCSFQDMDFGRILKNVKLFSQKKSLKNHYSLA